MVIAAIPKDAMVMEAGQVKAGSTRFLNGTWRAMLDVKDPVTGKPPSLRYQIQNNKGFARVVHGDNASVQRALPRLLIISSPLLCRPEKTSTRHTTLSPCTTRAKPLLFWI